MKKAKKAVRATVAGSQRVPPAVLEPARVQGGVGAGQGGGSDADLLRDEDQQHNETLVRDRLRQVQGGLAEDVSDADLLGHHGNQHNETLVRDDRRSR